MEAVKPKRNKQKKQQQARKKSDAHAGEDAPSQTQQLSVDAVKRAGVEHESGDVGQLRTKRADSSGSASSDTAEEQFLDADMDSVEADIMQDMLAAMEQDMEQPDESNRVESESRTSVEVDLQDKETKEEGVVTDYEITQNEDDLLSFLGAAPMSSESPYASVPSLPKKGESAMQLLTIEFPAGDLDKPLAQPLDESGDAVPQAGASSAIERTSVNAAQPERHSSVESNLDAPQTPSAPAFDEDRDFVASSAAPQAFPKTFMRTLSAPSAPNFTDSDDEHPSMMAFDTIHTPFPPAVQVLKKQTDGLVATGAPEGFPDSSPSGPRVTTPSAPPEIDLDDTEVGFAKEEMPGGGLPGSFPSGTKLPMPSAPPDIDVNTASPVKVTSFAASAPPEIDVHDKSPAQSTSVAPSAPTMPSLSPTAAKTISRASSGVDAERSTTESAKAKSPENVGTAVRNSFSKARMLEASRNLYPSVPQSLPTSTTRAAGGSSFAHVSADGQVLANGALAARQKRILIKLEPFVNFEMNLMRAEASQKRQEMKMQRIEINKGELHSRLERYLYSEYLLHTAASSLETSKTEVDTLMKKGEFMICYAWYY